MPIFFSSAKRRVIPLLLLSGVILIPLFSKANPMKCEEVFGSSRASFQENVKALRQLDAGQQALDSLINRGPVWYEEEENKGTWERKVQVLLSDLETQTENHLTANGIQFEKIPVSLQKFQVPFSSANPIIQNLAYKRFEIIGEDFSDENGKLMNGFLRHPRVSDVKLILDPGYRLWNPSRSAAKFDKNENVVYYSIYSLFSPYFGYKNILRHEMQHVFEHKKLLAGEPTLAGFE